MIENIKAQKKEIIFENGRFGFWSEICEADGFLSEIKFFRKETVRKPELAVKF